MTQVRLQNIKDKSYVDVRATIQTAKKALQTNNSITLVARQTQIARVGMVIKMIEQQCNCKVTALKNQNKTQEVDDKEGKKQVTVLYFRATLTKN